MGGRLIALEGIDGSGTTSQADALAKRLRTRGHVVIPTHQPSDGSIGTMIRDRLARDRAQDPAALALLFAADRLDHLRTVIEPALARGEVVVCDRYVVSSLVYQSLECDPSWVHQINSRARPADLTLILQLSPAVARKRVQARQDETGQAQERYDDDDTQDRLARGYAAVVRSYERGRVDVVDGDRPIEAITDDLVALCEELGL